LGLVKLLVHFDCHQYTIKIPTILHKNKTMERIFRRQNTKRMEKKMHKTYAPHEKSDKIPSRIVTIGAYASKEKSISSVNVQN